MGYEELKKLVIRKLEINPDYLDEQIEIFDNNVALVESCGLVYSKGEERSKEILDWLVKIREQLKSTYI